MRRLFRGEFDCIYMKFNTCTQDERRQGYRCNLTGEKCVGHMTLPLPYFDINALQWNPCGLYAISRKSIVMRCPSRRLEGDRR
jgi:hypothetical protein